MIIDMKKLSDEDFNKVVKKELNKYEPYWKKVIQIRASVWGMVWIIM